MEYFVGSLYFVLLLIMGAVLFSVKKYRMSVKKNWKIILVFSIVGFIIMNVLLFIFLRQENFISYWEFGGFWKKTLEFNDLLSKNIGDAIHFTVDSMKFSEYSYLPEWFLSTPMYLVGNTYLKFVLLMFNCFVMVFNVLLFSLVLMVLDDFKKRNNITVFIFSIIILFFSGNVFPMTLGYIGSAALPFIISIIILVYSKVLEDKLSWYSVYIGLVLMLIVLIRRWYAYTVVGFFLGFGISYLIKAFLEKENIKKTVFPRYMNLFICGIIPLGIMLWGFPELFKTFISYDYSFAYGDIQARSIGEIMTWFFRYYGIVYVCFMLFGMYKAVGNNKTKWIAIAFIISILFSLISFNQIQMMGSHHYYIINTYILLFILFGIEAVMERLQKAQGKKCIYGLVAIILSIILINTSYLFVNERGSKIRNISEMMIANSFPELRVRNDVEKIQEITNFLKNSIGDSSIYVLATSASFSEDILMNSLLPYDLRPISNMANSHVWDKRDGVPKQFFNYQYVVVADPIQFQFEPESHRVVSILAEEIMDGTLTQYYDQIIAYEITNGITVRIYKRNIEISREVRDLISDMFKEYYPEYPFLYEFD